MKTKYGKNGPIASTFFNQWNINDEMSGVLAGAANMALSSSPVPSNLCQIEIIHQLPRPLPVTQA